MTATEKRAYQRGYTAGRKRLNTDRERELWLQVFSSLVPQADKSGAPRTYYERGVK